MGDLRIERSPFGEQRLEAGARRSTDQQRSPSRLPDPARRLGRRDLEPDHVALLAQEGAVPKVVYFMTVDKAKFRKPVVPGDTVEYHVKKIRRRTNIWRFAAVALVDGGKVAEAEVSAMLVTE